MGRPVPRGTDVADQAQPRHTAWVRTRRPNWKTISSSTVFENAWISVFDRQVVNPRGGINDYGVVSFKNLAVGVIPIADNGDTWLVGQQRYTLDEYSWEIPEGGAPLNEDPLEGAKRELAEETGLRAAQWDQILRLHTSNSVTDEEALIWVARDLSVGDTDFDETEVIERRRLPLTEAVEMARTGDITDAMSVAGLLRAGEWYASLGRA